MVRVHVNCGVRLCAVCNMRCAVCGIRIHAACGSVQQSARLCPAVCGSARGSVQLSGSARGSVRLSSGAAVCGSPAACTFSKNSKHIRINPE
jgi:hypothetical protein